MRDLMPTSDLSRMSMAKELQTSVSRVPATLSHLETWLNDYIHELDSGMIVGAMLAHSGQGHYGDRCVKRCSHGE
eukprot:3931314-Prorocentrum_lima.AAC.1